MDVVDSCLKNRVCLKGIISSPLRPTSGILQTLNMKIRLGVLNWDHQSITCSMGKLPIVTYFGTVFGAQIRKESLKHERVIMDKAFHKMYESDVC